MSEPCFAFGPGNSLFLSNSKRWSYTPDNEHGKSGAPSATEWDTTKISQFYSVSFSNDLGWYRAYADQEGLFHWQLSRCKKSCPRFGGRKRKWIYTRDVAQELTSWMTKIITTKEEVQKFRIAFGPGATYFAWSLKEFKWNDLPKALEDEITAWTKSKGCDYLPTSVTFGRDNAWYAMWPDNMYRFDFAGQYDEAEKRIKLSTTTGPKRLKYAVLNPFVKNEHYFLFENGSQFLRHSSQARSSSHLKVFIEDVFRETPHNDDRTITLGWNVNSENSVSTTIFSPLETVAVTTVANEHEEKGPTATAAANEVKTSTIDSEHAEPVSDPLQIVVKEAPDTLPSPSTAPPSYEELGRKDTTVDAARNPIGTVLQNTVPPKKKDSGTISKTTVGVAGVLIGAAVCNVM